MSEQSGSESIEDGTSLHPRHWRMLELIFFFYIAVLIILYFFFFSVEERVGSSEAQGRLFLNKVFHISANKMFELLYTDSSFMRRFMNIMKIYSKCYTFFFF